MTSQFIVRVRELLNGTYSDDSSTAGQDLSGALMKEQVAEWMAVLARESFQPTLELPTLLDGLLAFGIFMWFGAPGVTGGDIFTCSESFQFAKPSAHTTSAANIIADTLKSSLCACEWSGETLSAVVRVIRLVKEPRVRQKALSFFNEAVYSEARSHAASKILSDDTTAMFEGMIDLLIVGITDLWSAIRKDAAKAATKAAVLFPTSEILDRYINRLLLVLADVQPVDSPAYTIRAWTEHEGALVAISQLLHSIVKGSSHQNNVTQSDRLQQAVTYRVGQGLQLLRLPQGIVVSLKPVLYRFLQHEQLTIRQGAADCMAGFAGLCEEPGRLAIFQETISKLNRIPHEKLLSSATLHVNTLALDAFEAEGLLNLLSMIVTGLSPPFLVKHWRLVFGTLERYMAHPASSVRQRSSSIVRALAQLSLVHPINQSGVLDGAATHLFILLILSLSNSSDLLSDASWQKLEGRLLSIDGVAELIGKWVVRSEFLRVDAFALSMADVSSINLLDKFKLRWAHEQLQASTWAIESSDRLEAPTLVSIMDQLDQWLVENDGNHKLPKTSSLLWEEAIGGWLSQAVSGISSKQFELRRISTQVLPSLMRLCIWFRQPRVVQQMVFGQSEVEVNAVRWYCGKFLVLHLRYLREWESAVNRSLEKLELALWEDVIWSAGGKLVRSSKREQGGTEVGVVRAEMLAMLFAHFEPLQKPPEQLLEILDLLLWDLHQNLPDTFRTNEGHVSKRRESSFIDRQMYINLIKMLPAVASATIQMFDRSATELAHAFSTEKRWVALERVVLAWLSSDDMARWITLSKSTGRMQLLSTLLTLIQHEPMTLDATDILSEFDLILRSTANILDHPKLICELYLSMWSHWCDRADIPIDEFVSFLAKRLASTPINGSTKSIDTSNATTAEWDDWDEDETRAPSSISDGDVTQEGGLELSLVGMTKAMANRLLHAVRIVRDRTDQTSEQWTNLKLLDTALELGIPRLL